MALEQDHPQPARGRVEGRADPGHAATDDDEIDVGTVAEARELLRSAPRIERTRDVRKIEHRPFILTS